jgi:hypothetical protein
MKNTPSGKHRSRSAPQSPSWIVERDALRLFGDRRSRAILAIYHARRSANRQEFFVHPDIAGVNGLSPADLNWALDKLEGVLIETLMSKSGKYRLLQLLPQYEEAIVKPYTEYQRITPPAPPGEERVFIDTDAVLANIRREGYLGCVKRPHP